MRIVLGGAVLAGILISSFLIKASLARKLIGPEGLITETTALIVGIIIALLTYKRYRQVT